MELIEYLKYLIEKTNEKLTRLITKYDDMSNIKLIDASRQVFDDLNLYIQLKHNQVLPRLEAVKIDGTSRKQVQESLEIDACIGYMLEKLQMIHVDEPWHEYREKLKKLKEYVDQVEAFDKSSFYPLIRDNLTNEECDDVIDRIRDEQTHEAKASVLTHSEKAN